MRYNLCAGWIAPKPVGYLPWCVHAAAADAALVDIAPSGVKGENEGDERSLVWRRQYSVVNTRDMARSVWICLCYLGTLCFTGSAYYESGKYILHFIFGLK
jgi:hypothetical protein